MSKKLWPKLALTLSLVLSIAALASPTLAAPLPLGDYSAWILMGGSTGWESLHLEITLLPDNKVEVGDSSVGGTGRYLHYHSGGEEFLILAFPQDTGGFSPPLSTAFVAQRSTASGGRWLGSATTGQIGSNHLWYMSAGPSAKTEFDQTIMESMSVSRVLKGKTLKLETIEPDAPEPVVAKSDVKFGVGNANTLVITQEGSTHERSGSFAAADLPDGSTVAVMIDDQSRAAFGGVFTGALQFEGLIAVQRTGTKQHEFRVKP